MHPNHTTPHISPVPSKPVFPGYYSLIPLVVLILIGCIVAVVKILLCYYCPLQQKSKPCPQTTSQCMPDQRCAISRGNYGFFHILSSQGCVDSKLCGSHKVISYQGVKYNVSYTCCCKNQCNIPPKSDTQRMGGATRFHYTLHK
uniref:UPAR/Ly6 domain-containing protein n=1 Tax=Neolamprologus brichardi TaxID=32507 RepID=A0A3Q4M4X7_NEOBR